MGVFSKTKDRLLEQAALPYLNTKLLAPYGRATSLRIDSSAKTIRIEVELKGETMPVEIDIVDYDITKEGDRYFATVKEVRTSREWLTALAKTQVRKSRFELPAKAGRLLLLAL
jgi:hypothetical protein